MRPSNVFSSASLFFLVLTSFGSSFILVDYLDSLFGTTGLFMVLSPRQTDSLVVRMVIHRPHYLQWLRMECASLNNDENEQPASGEDGPMDETVQVVPWSRQLARGDFEYTG